MLATLSLCIYEHGISLHLFRLFLISFSNILWVSKKSVECFFAKLISKYFKFLAT